MWIDQNKKGMDRLRHHWQSTLYLKNHSYQNMYVKNKSCFPIFLFFNGKKIRKIPMLFEKEKLFRSQNCAIFGLPSQINPSMYLEHFYGCFHKTLALLTHSATINCSCEVTLWLGGHPWSTSALFKGEGFAKYWHLMTWGKSIILDSRLTYFMNGLWQHQIPSFLRPPADRG